MAIENFQTNYHQPVLIKEIVDFLKTKKISGRKVFDGTFGGGGYSKAFLNLNLKVWACDKDFEVVKNQSELTNLELKHASFLNYIRQFPENFFDVVTLDLGYSSNQLHYSQRGFSYQNPKEEFDLRFDKTTGKPCWKLLFEIKSSQELKKIIFKNSGEPLSSRIAMKLFDWVQKTRSLNGKKFSPILVEEILKILETAIPAKYYNRRNSILSRFWQSMRIWVNQEFFELENFLPLAVKKLNSGGFLMIVSFHSLEDKIVTSFMRKIAIADELDEYGNTYKKFELLTKKAIKPSENEISSNPQCRSATLRILQKY